MPRTRVEHEVSLILERITQMAAQIEVLNDSLLDLRTDVYELKNQRGVAQCGTESTD